jgi:DNA excision repair protein ERCC-2
VANLATMLSTFFKGFAVIIEPQQKESKSLDCIMQFYCLDASIAMNHITSKYRNVVLTSTTLSPLDMYEKILDLKPKLVKAFGITLPRSSLSSLYPCVLTKGADQLAVSSKFDERENTGVVRNFGNMLMELAVIVPDGMICYFTSHKYMEHIIVKWNEMGILQRVLETKLIFIETKCS